MSVLFDSMLLLGILAWFVAARASVAWAMKPLQNARAKGAVPLEGGESARRVADVEEGSA